MPKNITPEILAKLEPYLEQLDASWESQSEGLRQPTLPITVDGKVNVRGIAKAIGLRQSQEQHFFRKPELASPINALAQVQGVKPIGSRLLADQHDKSAADRLARTATEKNDLARALAEKEAEIEFLREENTMLLSQLAQIESTGTAIRTEWPED
ncbi:MAG: hypothetical protein CL942_09585 [Desulfovibrio sp.]|nr:hypothetical protein [Desulfovibrio sp.]|tara:strand:+ start:1769 stop:2233 length:465 start_codon:yes stop_codon:yes gene_type:complete